ncbi:hypothetical protein HPP92_004538 [Vanilla planifolia]|uniref:Uncharacterized protein n=1 Tax=Vanilla planifolia TaxID=51239 RepID=A0A835RQJ1_VANPL|nr:hypothetical protein HPP92_004538 [Vanilla planifolia]
MRRRRTSRERRRRRTERDGRYGGLLGNKGESFGPDVRISSDFGYDLSAEREKLRTLLKISNNSEERRRRGTAEEKQSEGVKKE